jgi:hypothetical protein
MPIAPARRWGAGTSALVRALIAAERPVTQTELAMLVGVTQPRVSQVVGRLVDQSAVVAEAGGYVGWREKLVALYVEHHGPALVGPEVPWYGVQPLHEQTERVVAFAAKVSARVAVSADVAPDLLASWRHPTVAVVYTDTSLDLTAVGFVPAEGRVDATVLVRHTSDTTLLAPFPPWPRQARGVPLADPVQQVWDLHDLGGEDRAEAAGHLERKVLGLEVSAS